MKDKKGYDLTHDDKFGIKTDNLNVVSNLLIKDPNLKQTNSVGNALNLYDVTWYRLMDLNKYFPQSYFSLSKINRTILPPPELNNHNISDLLINRSLKQCLHILKNNFKEYNIAIVRSDDIKFKIDRKLDKFRIQLSFNEGLVSNAFIG